MKVWRSLRPTLSVKREYYLVSRRHSRCAGAKGSLPPWPWMDWGTHRGDPLLSRQLAVIQHRLSTTKTPQVPTVILYHCFRGSRSKIKHTDRITIPWGFVPQVSRWEFSRNLVREDTAPEAEMWARLCLQFGISHLLSLMINQSLEIELLDHDRASLRLSAFFQSCT